MNSVNFKCRFFIVLFLFTYVSAYPNEAEPKKNHLNFSFSGLKIVDEYYYFEDYSFNLLVNYNHNINNYFSIGIYSGIGIYEEWKGQKDDNSIVLEYNLRHPLSLYYGVNSNLNLMPLFFKTNIPRFDFYLSGKVGVISLFSSSGENIIPQRGNYFDYSVMLGSTLYLSKKMGLNTEIGYKNFEYHKGFNALFGLRFRF